ncbi:ABC transporter permease [Dethiosulfatarculus sandiegensis]|uniref:ABC transporter permease n=1 Tax=Dethiosulfatarculus sandiegensis TaxID=1429043 RepID=A0A0D2G9G5_9BACT|nr:ABC transporter permease [Dethiosulfatarculus sandiegensis]
MLKPFELLGRNTMRGLEEAGEILLLLIQSALWFIRPPFRLRLFLKQMDFVGVRSFNVVVLTGVFTGGVFALQTYHGFALFGAETLVGSTVALALTRELGPVLSALMVTARAGSAMAAELGTMRVTEQIDALYVMAVNPVQYLVLPRVLAAIIMLPLLTVIADFTGIVASYLVGVGMLGIDYGIFTAKIIEYLEVEDILTGLAKASFFGLILAVVGCYKGFYTTGGAEGVGRATTEAVVLACILILAGDYVLTALMF